MRRKQGSDESPVPICFSRSDVARYEHVWDKDGVCIYCDSKRGHQAGTQASPADMWRK